MLDPEVAAQTGAKGLAQLHQILDHGEPISFETVGWNVVLFRPFDQTKPKTRNVYLTYQLHFLNAWVVASVVISSTGQANRVRGIKLQPIPDSLQVLNRFNLQGKTAFHYAFLTFFVLVPVLMLATVIVCLRSRVRRRWLWILFIIVGFGQFQFNWSTGACNFQPLAVLFLGFGVWRPGMYAPWILKSAIPIGAIAFLILRHRLQRAASGSTEVAPNSS